MKSARLKVAQFGLGPIGVETLKLAASKPWIEIVGGVDCDPCKAGRDLAELTAMEKLHGLQAERSLEALLKRAEPDLIFHTTVSKFRDAFPQIAAMVRCGINVVSSCEELVYPQLRAPRLAARLDKLCRRHNSRVVGTGVNPGFVMDLLPVCLTGVTREIRGIWIERVVNASIRREPLQRKIGSGLRPAVFKRLLREGKAGHAGLRESLALIVHSLGLKLARLDETGEPVVAQQKVVTRYFEVAKGRTCGLHQRAAGVTTDGVRLTLELTMFLDAPGPHDAIWIDGDPPLDMVITGGVAGDQATVAALVNAAPQLLRTPPGLRLVTELAVPRIGAFKHPA